MKFHTKFDHAPGVVFNSNKPSMADPQYKDDCDINHVVNLATRGVVPDHVIHDKGTFADVSEFGDYAYMMDVVNRGTQAFMDVPSSIRARFGNDPRAFYSFCLDPDNIPELVRLGLAAYAPKVEAAPVRVEVVNPAKDSSKASA